MVDYESQFERPEYAASKQSLGQIQIATTFKLVYGWMAAGLALSGLVAWYIAASGLWRQILSGPGLIACIVAELALVIILSASIKKFFLSLLRLFSKDR